MVSSTLLQDHGGRVHDMAEAENVPHEAESIPYSRLAGAGFRQPAPGTILNFGKTVFVRWNRRSIVFRLVARPNGFIECLKTGIIRFRQEDRPGMADGGT